ncbi:G1 family glutamic endopeptidase [Actinokineospora alba]|uniref:G1 family glutamic endopeptidase n=1 Tax=Actinokineospora alba TaxID=504798 RepID=UPI000B85BA71|nr:G1 family glutamic endopeptidase [Actinokineospora alba]
MYAPTKLCAELLAVTTDADGDLHHSFKMPNGLLVDQVVPGKTFDPATASVARLAKVGLPPRPASGAAVSDGLSRVDWESIVRGRTRAIPKPPCVKPGVRAAIYNNNYSGYRAAAASGEKYSGAHSSITAPSYYLSACAYESMTQWVGVSNDSVLVQAGVYVDQYTGTVDSGGFIEFVGGTWDTGGVTDVGVPYVAGHRYYLDVHYADRYNWSLTVSDLDNGENFSGFWTHPSGGGTQYLQPFAYFISERLTYSVNGGPGTLTQYMSHSDVRFRTATAKIYGAGDARLSIQRPEQMIMLSPGIGNQRLGNVDPLEVSASNFTEHWARCGVVE